MQAKAEETKPENIEESRAMAKELSAKPGLVALRQPEVLIEGGDDTIDEHGPRLNYDVSFYEKSKDRCTNFVIFSLNVIKAFKDPEPIQEGFDLIVRYDFKSYIPKIANDAQKLLVKGDCLTSLPEVFPGEGAIVKREWTYFYGLCQCHVSPLSRFYVEIQDIDTLSQHGLKHYEAYDVPAIDPAYLDAELDNEVLS